jgi:hypothetical protein
VRPRLDEVDYAHSRIGPCPNFEHVTDLDGRWDVGHAKVVALATAAHAATPITVGSSQRAGLLAGLLGQ